MFKRILTPIIATSAFSVLLAACSGLTHRTSADHASISQRKASYAIAQTEPTSLGKALDERIRSNPGKSGFHLLPTGDKSLEARFGLIQAAEKTIDLQYYAISDDVTSNIMLETIMQAAARGVRIRFLIDDISITSIQKSLSALDNLDNVEIRIFNPITSAQNQNIVSRFVVALTHIDQVTKRMHNKALISDNQLAIIGGRNLGDEYFDANPAMSFKDIDILTAGPITADISRSFDEFWNDKNAFPIADLYDSDDSGRDLKLLKEKIRKKWNEHIKDPEEKRRIEASYINALQNQDVTLTWAPARIVADKPEKISEYSQDQSQEQETNPINVMIQMAENAQHEFIIVSPYFVPRERGLEWILSLKKKGINVRILTNSLASTDVVAVHTGYQKYREELVRNGIELYELKPVGDKRPKQRPLGLKTPAYASLHAKAYVIDGKETIIGSFNLDPRSYNLNTEIAIAIDSPEISQKISAMFEKSIVPETSYKIVPEGNSGIAWVGQKQGKDVRYGHEPDSSIWRRVQNFFISLLPVESQL